MSAAARQQAPRRPSLADDVHGPRRPYTSDQIAAAARLLLAAQDLPPVDWELEPDPETRLRKAREYRFSEHFGIRRRQSRDTDHGDRDRAPALETG